MIVSFIIPCLERVGKRVYPAQEGAEILRPSAPGSIRKPCEPACRMVTSLSKQLIEEIALRFKVVHLKSRQHMIKNVRRARLFLTGLRIFLCWRIRQATRGNSIGTSLEGRGQLKSHDRLLSARRAVQIVVIHSKK